MSSDDAGSARVTKADDPTSTDETARCRNGPRSIGRGRSSPSLESELTEHASVRKRRCCRDASLTSIQEQESATGAAAQEADQGGITQLWIMTIAKQNVSASPKKNNPPHSRCGIVKIFAPPSPRRGEPSSTRKSQRLGLMFQRRLSQRAEWWRLRPPDALAICTQNMLCSMLRDLMSRPGGHTFDTRVGTRNVDILFFHF